ncbi:hypothetical protein [Undibacterium flavidum]|uniref:Uncharacterized protein n=1 Tax=Undibacterium flavidum TaxID=2762297 RepID=A0ABR6YBQ4_9BURK|nr:hypothetical protein [Undibacterium flavidum]MBC3874060.1 hypothetical protein [Undibacterium flavidum]
MKLFIGFLLFCVLLNAKSADQNSIPLHLKNGESARRSGAFEIAISECKTGIEKLGDRYFDEDVIDDTGQKILLADIKVGEKELKTASLLYCSMLEERIGIYNRKLEKKKSRQIDKALTGQSTENRQ